MFYNNCLHIDGLSTIERLKMEMSKIIINLTFEYAHNKNAGNAIKKLFFSLEEMIKESFYKKFNIYLMPQINHCICITIADHENTLSISKHFSFELINENTFDYNTIHKILMDMLSELIYAITFGARTNNAA